MSIKSFIALQANGIRIVISGWGNNKMFLKTYIIYTCYMILLAGVGNEREKKRFIK